MIKLLILDVDGVLTNGKKIYDINGNVVYKEFCDKDWTYIKIFKSLNINVVFLTGDSFNKKIAKKRNIKVYINRKNNTHKDKIYFLKPICKEYSLKPEQIVYVGDDIFDLKLLNAVGYAFCPKDAPDIFDKNVKRLKKNGGDNLLIELFKFLQNKKLIPKLNLNKQIDKIYDLDIKEKF